MLVLSPVQCTGSVGALVCSFYGSLKVFTMWRRDPRPPTNLKRGSKFQQNEDQRGHSPIQGGDVARRFCCVENYGSPLSLIVEH